MYDRAREWVSLDAHTGATRFKLNDFAKGPLLYADKRLYCLSEQGEAVLLNPGPEAFEVKGRFRLVPERKSDASWHENVPLLGWLRLRGRCASCGAGISARYPLVEAFTAALFAAVAVKSGPGAAPLVWCLAGAVLVAAALIDLDTTLLPDDLTLPLIGLGIVAAWRHWTPVSLADASLGAFFGYFALWAVARTYRAVRHVDGMAEGDFKPLAGLGALLGWQALPAIVLLSSAVGALVGIFMIVARGHQRSVPIPFGPSFTD